MAEPAGPRNWVEFKDLQAAARRRGYRITQTQVAGWVRVRFLRRPSRPGKGYGAGRASGRFPPEAVEVVVAICEIRNLRESGRRPRAVSNARLALELWLRGKALRSPALLRAAVRSYALVAMRQVARVSKRVKLAMRDDSGLVASPFDKAIARLPRGPFGNALRAIKRSGTQGDAVGGAIGLRVASDVMLRVLNVDFARFASRQERDATAQATLVAPESLLPNLTPPINPDTLKGLVDQVRARIESPESGDRRLEDALRTVSRMVQNEGLVEDLDKVSDGDLLEFAARTEPALATAPDEILQVIYALACTRLVLTHRALT